MEFLHKPRLIVDKGHQKAELHTNMIELNDFYNDGTGWVCRHCELELTRVDETPSGLSRAFREGEVESKTPTLANAALAKWLDKTRQVLICPRCGITEPVEKS